MAIKKKTRKFIAYNTTINKFISIPALARLLNIPQRTFYDRLEVEFSDKNSINYTDENSGENYTITIYK
jgi:hypothetical protein